MKKILFFLVWITGIKAQQDSSLARELNALHTQLQLDSSHAYRFKVFRPYAALDNRHSFLISRPANVSGFQLGFILNEYHTFGLGAYRLSRINPKRVLLQQNEKLNHLEYLTLFYEYMLVNKRYFEVDLPFELGLGFYGSNRKDSTGLPLAEEINRAFVPMGAGGKLILKPVRWIGLSLMGGYRFVLEKNPNLNFNGAYYAIGIWIDIRQIYRDIKYYGFIKRQFRKKVNRLMAPVTTSN